VRDTVEEDWINHFNIGNIMHLQALGFDELNYQTQNKIGLHNPNNFILNETTRDNLLFKALYSIVAYFCIGTELRFLAVLHPQQYTIKDSELWHAKAIHLASFFLPNECPLTNHISTSYTKHHLRPKIRRRQE